MVYVALYEYTICMGINLDIVIYPTLYEELGDIIITFCNKIKIKNQAVEISLSLLCEHYMRCVFASTDSDLPVTKGKILA